MATWQKTIEACFELAFFFRGMLMSLFPRLQQLSRLLRLRLHITVQSGLETKKASTGVITEGFYE